MKTVLSPTIRARISTVRDLRKLVASALEIHQMIAKLLHELFGPRACAKAGQSHIEGVAIDSYGFGKLAAAPLFIEAQSGPQYLTLYAEIVYRHNSPNLWTPYGRT